MIEAYKLNVFRCKLCGEAILMSTKPTTCPFCGAHHDYVMDAENWKDENNVSNMTAISRGNLEKALQLETDNTQFYKCAKSYAQDPVIQAMFKSLSKVEAEHAEVISKILRKPKRDIGMIDVCFRLDQENIRNSFKREEKAKEFYINAYNQAIEPRVKELFFGLIEVEGDHVELIKHILQ